MKTVIYLDVLLLTNFLIGYALLAAAGLLAGMQARFGRMVLASLLAASSALILLAPELTYPQQLVYKVGTAAVITAAAFGVRPLRRYAAVLGWFAALNLLLAGLCILVILRTGSSAYFAGAARASGRGMQRGSLVGALPVCQALRPGPHGRAAG